MFNDSLIILNTLKDYGYSHSILSAQNSSHLYCLGFCKSRIMIKTVQLLESPKCSFQSEFIALRAEAYYTANSNVAKKRELSIFLAGKKI